MVHKVTLPSIHMNGTSAKTLYDEIRKACSDLQMARMAVARNDALENAIAEDKTDEELKAIVAAFSGVEVA